MPTENHVRIPRYGKHVTGQTVIRLNGKDHYLRTSHKYKASMIQRSWPFLRPRLWL